MLVLSIIEESFILFRSPKL